MADDENEAAAKRVMTVLSVIAFFSLMAGIASYILNVEKNRCEMTYMYQMPTYIPVPMAKSKDPSFARYKLYVYGEGIYNDQLRAELSVKKLTGVPVLFIPGSGGSHAQVRSLASVLLRKGENLRSNIQFNVFSIDFGEDFSALDGALLQKQSEFVSKCLKQITRFYPKRKSDNQDASIIVYGHSMGGVLTVMAAQKMAELGHDGLIAPLLLTYSSPFARPPLYIDPHLEYLYSNLFLNFPKTKFLVSVAGGFRDHLVPSQLPMINISNSLDVNTMSTPLAWASADHKCIVWCRQIVLASARTLYELVDSKSGRMTSDLDVIRSTVSKHFAVSGEIPRGKDVESQNPDVTIKTGQATVAKSKGHTATISLPESDFSQLVIMHNWPGSVTIDCSGESRAELQSYRMLPPLYSNKRVMFYQFENPVPSQECNLNFGAISAKSYRLAWTLEFVQPVFGDNIFNQSFPTMGSAFKKMFSPTLISSDIANRLFVRVSLTEFESPYMGATFRLTPKQCSKNSNAINGSVVLFRNADNIDEAYEYGQVGQSISLTLRKQVTNGQNPSVFVFLDPSCQYSMDIKWSFPDVCAQYIRFAGHLFPTILGLVLMSFLMATIRTLDKPDDSYLATYVFFHCKPVGIVAFSKIIHMLFARLGSSFLPVAFDFDLIAAEGDNVMFGTMPVLLYFFVLGLFGFYMQILSLVFGLFGRIFSFLKRLTRSTLFFALALQLGSIVCELLYSTGLGLFFTYLSFLFPLLCLSAGANKQVQQHFFALTLLALWFCLIAGPTLLHQFFLPLSEGFDFASYSPVLTTTDGTSRFDLWLLPGSLSFSIGSIIFTLATIKIIGSNGEKLEVTVSSDQRKALQAPVRILQGGAIIGCLFASKHLYRAPTIFGISFALAAMLQLFYTIMFQQKGEKRIEHPKND